MSIQLTDKAAEHVKKFLIDKDASALRLSVKTTGCSGYSYVVGVEENISDQDQVFVSKDINIVVEKSSMEYLNGTEIDYVKEGLKEGFQFNNPNVAEMCGCGESFTI